jgi:hypothetical protein
VRRDLKLLSARTAVISSSELCAACGRAILDPPPNPLRLPSGGAVPPFYLFPSAQAFHVLCAAAEVVAYGGDARAGRTRKLLQRLSKAEPSSAAAAKAANGFGEEPVAALAGAVVWLCLAGTGKGAANHADGALAAAISGWPHVVASPPERRCSCCCPACAALPHTAKLEEEVGCEDPWNGELLVRMLDMPFVNPDKDGEEIDSWCI